ncbi:hypothetical protein O0I10_011557 [Lichtheimia ornata]|uniref:F-box domain-containing protein n=1 Tax=Lichtheimia ornata TaxID=688661 RepID=A0AAD7USR0_9FUNG|nr:uncharacterized protein O0I10_011557 [Lichtheimia ornata]KAJ8652818.1 hypothetical protein O0I10_011557 [Lichtheimia ornata]
MEANNSDDSSIRSALVNLIGNRYQNPGVDESLMGNDELLRRVSAELGMLLCMKKVDEALSVAKEIMSMAPTSSTAALYQHLITKFKELSYQMDQAATSMATLYYSITKVDFISRLPFDIVSHIVDYLWESIPTMNAATPTFLYVSKCWRKRILESTPFLSYQLPATKLLGYDKATFSHASRVRTMTIHGKVISFSRLLGNHLCNLSRLCIDIPRDSASCIHGHPSWVHDVCTAVRHNYSLDEIMETCPNLVSLKWSGWVLNGGTTKQYHQLRVLQLPDDEDEIDELLVKLPCLVVLSIRGIRNVDYFNRVSNYCPSLKCLKYNAAHDDLIEWPYEWDTGLQQGIQDLSFYEQPHNRRTEHVIDPLVHVSKTLKHLHIGENIYGDRHDPMFLPHDTTFPHLIHLTCDPEYRDDELDLFLDVLRRSPCLERIKSLQSSVKWYEPEPVDCMASCTRLVEANVIMDEDHQDVEALKRFLNTHIQRGNSSTLRSLEISLWTEECAYVLLPLITQLALLEELHLALSPNSPMPMIMDTIATNNAMKVKHLKISVVGWHVEDTFFDRLQHARTLKSLIIDADHLRTMAALSLRKLTQLTHLQIPFEGVDGVVIDILRKQFPNLKELEPRHIWQ